MPDRKRLIPVWRLRLAVIHASGQVLDFGCQRTAECDVEFLDAAADGEQRNAALDGAAEGTVRRFARRTRGARHPRAGDGSLRDRQRATRREDRDRYESVLCAV